MNSASPRRRSHSAPMASPADTAQLGSTTSPVTVQDALDRLERMRRQYERINALVSGAQLLDEVLALLVPVLSLPEPTFNLRQAADALGRSQAHLGRLVREGRIPNHGAKGRPLVRLSECRSLIAPRGRRQTEAAPAPGAA